MTTYLSMETKIFSAISLSQSLCLYGKKVFKWILLYDWRNFFPEQVHHCASRNAYFLSTRRGMAKCILGFWLKLFISQMRDMYLDTSMHCHQKRVGLSLSQPIASYLDIAEWWWARL